MTWRFAALHLGLVLVLSATFELTVYGWRGWSAAHIPTPWPMFLVMQSAVFIAYLSGRSEARKESR